MAANALKSLMGRPAMVANQLPSVTTPTAPRKNKDSLGIIRQIKEYDLVRTAAKFRPLDARTPIGCRRQNC